jgi:hypothetical protein
VTLPDITRETHLSERAGWELVQQAEALLTAPSEANGAEDFYRRVAAVEDAMRWARLSTTVCVAMGRVRLRAERRWGELLGPPERDTPPPGGVSDANAMGGAERVARREARRVAEVPAGAFEAYVTAEREDPPTRAGVLRAAPRPEPPEPPAEEGNQDQAQDAPSREAQRDRAGLANPISNALTAAQSAETGAYMALRTNPPDAELVAWLEELKQAQRALSRVRAKITTARRQHHARR